jgi:hypothetical protein
MDDDDADYMQGSDDEVEHSLSAPWMVQLTANYFTGLWFRLFRR